MLHSAKMPAHELASTHLPAAPTSALFEELRRLCAGQKRLLAHLYRPATLNYYHESRHEFERGRGWPLVATPGHGIFAPERPTLNFFVADERWATAYASAASNRGFFHGLLLLRAAIEQVARGPGFEFAEIRPGHPSIHGIVDPNDFWKFDIPSHRYRALHDLRFATVARLATPLRADAHRISVPCDAVVAWW